MAIIGESFEPWVKEQINTRQNKLSLQDKDDNILKYITNKTSFLRLTSGVDIVNDNAGLNKLRSMGLDGINKPITNFIGSNLAKDYVLFSAYFNNNFTTDVGYDRLGASYGFTTNTLYGLTPPPGIISADIKSLNRGSLREATINIICHNLLQFKIISALFLKLRYSLLLEWGHTMYFDNKGDLQTKFNIPNLSNDFLNKTISTQEDLLKKIESEREKSAGNYDAFFGVIKNFNWVLQENGSYNVTINAISTGDVIESLKINSNISPEQIVSNTPEEVKFQKSTLHKMLGDIQKKIEINGNYLHGVNGSEDWNLTSENISLFTGLKSNYVNPKDNSSVTSPNGILSYNEALSIWFKFLEIDEKGNSLTQYYIKLGTLLRVIESFLLYYDTSKKSNPPVFFIDHNFDNNECLTTPNQISLDPRVCLIPLSYDTSNFENIRNTKYKKVTTTYSYISQGDVWEIYNTISNSEDLQDLGENTLNKEIVLSFNSVKNNIKQSVPAKVLSNVGKEIDGIFITPKDIIGNAGDYSIGTFIDVVTIKYIEDNSFEDSLKKSTEQGTLQYLDKAFRTDNKFIGKVMNIYLNIDYMISILDSNINEDGTVPLFDFLTNLMNGVKKSLGYINDFEVIYKENINTYYIIDNSLSPLKYEDLNKKNIAKFNINLLKTQNNGGGSFVTNFGLKSELFSKIANTIALGAQANGNTGISNSTAFSEFNAGLVDRFLEKKLNNNVTPSEEDFSTKYAKAFNNYVEYRNRISQAGGRGIGLTSEDIDYFESFITDLFQYDLGFYTQKQNIPGTGFIPLNLQLTMDGLSGMKIYETFDIDETLLPDEYQSRIRFIIRGVNHKIDSKGWETNIETLSIPKLAGAINKNIKFPKIASGELKTRNKSLTFPPIGQINADRLRIAIKNAGYQDGRSSKGSQLNNSGYDILPATADAGIAFINDLKKQYPDYKIVFTAGNDKYHLDAYNTGKSNTTNHSEGRALDIAIENKDSTKIKNVVDIAKNYFILVLDEYTNPSPNSTGGHIHMNN
jgi:hypothetical protein